MRAMMRTAINAFWRSFPKRSFLSAGLNVGLGLGLVLSMAIAPLGAALAASSASPMFTQMHVPNGESRISIEASDQDLRSLLRDLSQQGGFNLVLDPSVTGTVSVQLSNVTINEALESVAALASLEILPQSGNIYLALSKEAAREKGLSRQLSRVIKVNYSNANRIAAVLNQSLFAQSGSGAAGSNQAQKVRADSRTNSVVVVGTAHEIELAEKAIAQLDVPRQSRTFYLSQANALDVASQLASSIFNDGTGSLMLGGASGGGSSGGASAGMSGGTGGMTIQPAALQVEKQDIEEGEGINDFGQEGSDTSAAVSQNVKLRGYVKSSESISVSPQGPLVVPDTRQNAVTVMGTAEQIALAESLIPILDARAPQVAIEASLVEVTSAGTKELENLMGIADGRLQVGFNNSSSIGLDADEGQSGISFSTNPVSRNSDYIGQVRALVQTSKARILANPTVVATHDTESIISIVDEIVRGVQVEIDENGFVTRTLDIGEAGIVLDILPKVGEDGTVTMRIRPSVRTILDTYTDSSGNQATLLSKRDLLTQSVRIRDGETLVIGGLIRESDVKSRSKLPGLGDLPIVGGMFRATTGTDNRSELVVLITPHIMNKTELTPVSYTDNDMPSLSRGSASW